MVSAAETEVQQFDVIVVGGGPAGSTCARLLVEAGKRVAVIDRSAFPRVKLCAGWLSEPVWPALGIDPEDYEGGLWRWQRCHVHFGSACHTVDVGGYFVRRYEFDDYLLRISGATVIQERVADIARDPGDGDWIINRRLRAPILVGAAGTHCPVSRHLFGVRDAKPAGALELEFECDADEVAGSRLGLDGEPELILHEDLRGYSWNVPKTGWLNVGTGTLNPKQVRSAWNRARTVFEGTGHVPATASASLDKVKGHSYHLFAPAHLDRCQSGPALLIGDSVGLAHPLTAEGIYPAIVSARLAAESIASDRLDSYPDRMRGHPLFLEYATIWRVRDTAGAFRSEAHAGSRQAAEPRQSTAPPTGLRRVSGWLLARGFAWMFAGRPVPGHQLIGPLIQVARKWDRMVSPQSREKRAALRRRDQS